MIRRSRKCFLFVFFVGLLSTSSLLYALFSVPLWGFTLSTGGYMKGQVDDKTLPESGVRIRDPATLESVSEDAHKSFRSGDLILGGGTGNRGGVMRTEPVLDKARAERLRRAVPKTLGRAVDRRQCRFPPQTLRQFFSAGNMQNLTQQFFTTEGDPSLPRWDSKHRNRMPSYPLLTGDGFRAMAHFICDDTGCSNAQMQPNTTLPPPRDGVPDDALIVFAKPDNLGKFCKNFLDKADRDIILITQNSALSAPDVWPQILDHPRLRAWLAKNGNVTHPKLRPIPIGVESRWGKIGSRPQEYMYWMSRSSELPPTKDVFVSFSIKTWPVERQACLDHFSAQNWATVRTKMSHQKRFSRSVLDHRFVACPRGTGIDTHRMFETLLLGRFPIVAHNYLVDRLYYDLPALVVDDWPDVDQYLLSKAYRKLANGKYSFAKLFMDYWLQFVRYVQVTRDWNRRDHEWDACMLKY